MELSLEREPSFRIKLLLLRRLIIYDLFSLDSGESSGLISLLFLVSSLLGLCSGSVGSLLGFLGISSLLVGSDLGVLGGLSGGSILLVLSSLLFGSFSLSLGFLSFFFLFCGGCVLFFLKVE